MRIIAGEARGRTLIAPSGNGTRPTQDYVRESLFNILSTRLSGARVLDLFAGTGALALEAISRGAEYAVLCDKDRAALSCIQKNIGVVRAENRCRIFPGDYVTCIHALSGVERFDLVFLDPPYRMENMGEIAGLLLDADLLLPGFLIVCEHRKGTFLANDRRFCKADRRLYGDTEITFLSSYEGE